MENKLKRIEDKEEKLSERQIDTEVKIARIDERQSHIMERLDSIHEDIINEIHRSVDGRIQDLSLIAEGQQKTLNKIIEVQGGQKQQIDGIKHTLDQFTKIKDRVDIVEKQNAILTTRIEKLEFDAKTESELKKEQIKGRWAVIGAVVSAISAVVCALIVALVNR